MDFDALLLKLNACILKFAPNTYRVSNFAPKTFEDLKREYAETGIIHVWSGASDTTIYGNANVNYAMRAWHDAIHLELNADFTLDGERRVALRQVELLGCPELGRIIIAEVLGQVEYFNKYREFPDNQLTFIKAYLENSKIALEHKV